MVQTFSSVLHMSLVGSIAILVVLAARLPLRKAPRWISFALWLVVLFRLLCPWSPSSVLSLIPDNLPDISSTAAFGLDSTPLYAAEAVVETAEDMLRGQPVREIMADVGPDWMPIRLEFQDVLLLFMGWLWPLGMGILTIYHLISYMRLRLQLLNTAASAFTMIMNEDVYNDMPEDLRKIIDEVSIEYGTKAFNKFWADGQYTALEKWTKEYGGTVHMLTAEEYKKANELMQPVMKEWIDVVTKAGLPGVELEKAFRELEQKYAQPWSESKAASYVKK